jgi:hypothetical protein
MLYRAKFSENPLNKNNKRKAGYVGACLLSQLWERHRLAKRAGFMAQVVECLLSKLETLGLHLSTATQKTTLLLLCLCNLDMWQITKHLLVYIYL